MLRVIGNKIHVFRILCKILQLCYIYFPLINHKLIALKKYNFVHMYNSERLVMTQCLFNIWKYRFMFLIHK